MQTISSVVNEVLNGEESAVYQRNAKLRQIAEPAVTEDTPSTASRSPSLSEGGEVAAALVEGQDPPLQNVEGKTFLQSSGEEVQSVAYKSIDNGSVTVTVNGSTEAAAGDVSFSNEGDAVLFESIPGINHITAEGANVIWNAWKSSGHSNAGAFGGAAAQVFKAGYLGDATILNTGDSRAAALTSAQKYAIYQQGRKAAAADYDSKQAKRYADNKKPAKEKKGGVYYGYDGKTIDQRNDGKHKPLTKTQRVGVDFVKRLSKKFGSTVYFYESYVDENGNRVCKDRNGNVVAAEKGFYDPKDGSIHIDLNSGKVLYTIAHELVHFITDWSPKHFKQMADIVMAGYSRENVPLDKLIADQQALAREHGRELTEDEAFEEVIANALEGVMADGKVAEFLRAIEGKDKSLGAKVRQFFQDVAKLIKDTLDAYAGVKPDSVEGKMTMQLEDVYRQLQQVFAEGVHQSGENFRRAERNTTDEGGVRYMSRSIEDVTKDTVKQDLTDVYNGNNVTSGSYIPLLKSTPFAVRYITGYKIDRPVIVDKKKSYFDMRENGKFKEDRSHHYHGMGIDGFIDALEILDDPEFAIQEEMDDGKLHYAFISTNESGEEVCVVFQMNVSKSPGQMNGYAGGYYNLDITEFVATDEWLEDHGAEPGMSYKDFLLSFPENSIAYDRSIHLEQLEKARNIDSGSAGLAASHINNRASENKVPQPETVVKENDSAKSDGIKRSIQQKENATVADMLKKENEKLRADVERLNELLKLQRTITGGTKFTASSVEAAARVLKKNAGATGNTAALAGLLNSFYEYIATGRELTWEGVREQAQIAVRWLQDHVKHRRSDYAQEILDQIHGSRIYLDESQKKEAAYRFGSFSDFHKSVMGSITIANDANTSLDSWWHEMASMYPDVFDGDLTASDMPGELADIIDRLRNEDTSLMEYAYNMDMIEQDLIRQVYDSYWNISTLRTFADVKQAQINRLKYDHIQRMNKLKDENRQKTEQLKAQHRADVEMIRSAYRQKLETQQKELSAKYQESRKKAVSKVRETAEKQVARKKLQKLVIDTAKWIAHPAKTDIKCPDLLKKPYSDFLNSIDMSSERLAKGGDPTKNDLRLTNAMNGLATALEKIVTGQDPDQETAEVFDSGYLDLPADFVEQLRDMATKITEMMVEGDYVVNSMTAAEVRQLSQMIRTLNHAVKTMSTLYANLRFSSIEALGVDTMEFLNALGEIEKSGGIKDFVHWENGLPYYVFKRFGTGGESVFEGLMDGQDKLAFHAKRLFAFQEKTWTAKEAKEWSEDVHTIELPSGGKLTLTTADAMSIYCLSRREQGLQHLLGGGTRVKGLQKGTQKAKDSRSRLTIKDVDAINASLTVRQKEVANAIQRFMSTVCAEWGNEISMKRFLTQ